MNDHSRRRERLHARAAAGLLAHAVLALCLAVSLVGIPADAVAADIGCGRDTDRSSAVDQACPEPDKDGDGYRSSAGTHFATGFTDVDCDDTNSAIIPGTIDTAGCSAGSFRRCKIDGTYTACAALSSAVATDFSNTTGPLALFYVDPTKTADTGTGSYASPLSPRSLSDAARSTYHAPAAGDVIVFQGTGNYASTWSDAGTLRMFYLNNKDGTAANPIRFVFLSGAHVVGQGVATTEVQPFQCLDSDYVTVQGEGAGTSINSGYSNSGLYFLNCDNAEIFGMTTRDIDGESDNNVGGFKFDSSDTPFIHNNVSYDNYERANATSFNAANIYVTKANAFRIIANTTNDAVDAGVGIKNKHIFAGTNTGSEITFNYVSNAYNEGIKYLDEKVTVKRNLLHTTLKSNSGGGAIRFVADGGGDFNNSLIQDNTIINSGFMEMKDDDSGVIGNPIFTASGNVVIDNRASAYTGTDYIDGFIRICHYCDQTTYNSNVGKFSYANNCYYNTNAVALAMGISAGSIPTWGVQYTSFALWQAAGYDSGSYSEDPTLDAYSRATSTNCADKGYLRTADVTSGTTPSTGSTSPGTIYNFLRRRR